MGDASQTRGKKEEGEDHKFIVFFLNEDEDQSVRVEEVEKVDLSEVVHHLSFGGSVFITHRRRPKRNPPESSKEKRGLSS